MMHTDPHTQVSHQLWLTLSLCRPHLSLPPSLRCRYNIRLMLALGNLWPAYFGPERWLYYAKGSAGAGMGGGR